ncbi:PD-(D/E)XK motif protein [Hyphomonas sp.]|uniref:PD-(D/E)XK motif protein n=1 Tax=Hyphomonas sp. TaxID=87 RepID=UPI0025BCE899|nr:PD-(D/E)XK motif protein [Hyphomonas sp.]
MTHLPWADIPLPDPQSVYTYRLADIDHPFEYFWARDRKGEFVFRFKGRFPVDRVGDAPSMSGITVTGEELDGHSYLNLTLEGTESADLFLALCKSLMSATHAVETGNDTAALDIVLTRLRRWQDLLKTGRKGTLGAEAQVGLFGELLILRDVFLSNLDPLEAVCCWTGPLGDEQDFGYSDSLVEVKTTRSTRDQSFRVNSMAQLDTTSGQITVAFQTLGVFENDPPNGISLNQMVEEVKTLLGGSSAAIAELDIRLALSKYESSPEYDQVHFVPVSRRMFSVTDDFPRIEPSEVRHGILRARYDVSVEACLDFELEPSDAIRRILEGTESVHLSPLETSPEDLVLLNESTELEFKSSVRWSYNENKIDKGLEFVIVKSVSAFANTMGGNLVIGVDDNNKVLGLEKDYETLGRDKSRDGFELHLVQLLINAFGTTFCAQNISITFPIVDDREICIVQVRRSKEMLSVEKLDKSGRKSKTYFVRSGNSSRELGVDEIIEYNRSR